MSRSRRHSPITGIAGHTESPAKRIWNRAFRKTSRRAISACSDYDGLALPLNIRKETETWDGIKEGKYYIAEPWPELWRK